MTTIVQATFRDTTAPENLIIDNSYQGVLAYANGRYAWPDSQVSRFLAAGKHVRLIDVDGSAPDLASILDVERYDASPATAAVWVHERNRIGNGDATVYISKANMPQLVEAIGHQTPCYVIVADWTGRPHMPDLGLIPRFATVACQYQNTPGYDLSCVLNLQWLMLGRIR